MNCNKELIKQKDIVINNLKKYFKQNNFKNVVIGISGGIDSALSLNILNEAFDKSNIFAYFIDIESNKQDYLDAQIVCKQLNIKLLYINLTKLYKKFKKLLNTNDLINLGNLKSRLRMIILYNQANQLKALVCGNSNLDELYLGYFTKYGDNACDFFLLNSFIKRDIHELAKYYKIDQRIISKQPSAGLYKDQTDEKELQLTYQEIDDFLLNKNSSTKIKNKIASLHRQNAHKLFYNYDINKWSKYTKIWKKIK